jgi:predicted neutral ceramidase superfamily lipid hydrolase
MDSVDDFKSLERQYRTAGKTIRTSCMLSFGFLMAMCIILIVVLSITSVLSGERKIFLGTVFAVMIVGLSIVLITTRDDPNSLVIFSNITSFVAGLGLGLCVWYL